jgi:hypothetical protein
LNEPVIRCPDLYGHNIEGDGYYAYPSSGNCCARRRPDRRRILFWLAPLPPFVTLEHQEEFCLSGRFHSCTLWGEAPAAAE